jgi:hypothetical protein
MSDDSTPTGPRFCDVSFSSASGSSFISADLGPLSQETVSGADFSVSDSELIVS